MGLRLVLMLKILVLTVGKLPQGPFGQIGQDFTNRLEHFAKIEHRAVKTDAELLERVPEGYLTVVLDAAGKSLSSEALAQKLSGWIDEGAKLAFIIGGPHGLTPAMKKAAHFQLSLSPMTTTHDLAQIFFLEQLYRAFTIVKGMTYHY